MGKILILAFIISASLLGCDPESPELPGEKSEWALLQGIEFEQRSTPIVDPTIKIVEGHEVLGVRSRDGKTNIWILLKVTAAPYYKQMPERPNYDLPKELVARLIGDRKVSYTVERVLRSHES